MAREYIEQFKTRLVLYLALPHSLTGRTMSPLVERYCRHWQAERSADALELFLAAHPDLSIAELVEVLLTDQTLGWRDAAGPSVEQYLRRFPAVADQPSLILELVCGELRAARDLGLTVDVDAYVVRFPDLAELLRRQMELSIWLADDAINVDPKIDLNSDDGSTLES